MSLVGNQPFSSSTEPIPRLCTLFAASAFDAALHDAFGKVHGRNCYQTYGPDLMTHDLGHYLGDAFRGEWLPRWSCPHHVPTAAVTESIGVRCRWGRHIELRGCFAVVVAVVVATNVEPIDRACAGLSSWR